MTVQQRRFGRLEVTTHTKRESISQFQTVAHVPIYPEPRTIVQPPGHLPYGQPPEAGNPGLPLVATV